MLVLDYLIVVVVVLGLAEPLQPGFPVVTLVIFIVAIIVEIIIILFKVLRLHFYQQITLHCRVTPTDDMRYLFA